MARPKKKLIPSVNVFTKIPVELFSEIKKAADENDRSVAWIMREAAAWWLKFNQDKRQTA